MGDTWRFIDAGPHSAAYNMAIDESIAAYVRRGFAPPTLRVYGWTRPSVSIGCFQRSCDIDPGYCRENDITMVRRPTGGRAVFHKNEITYSFSATTRTGLFSGGLFDSYKKIGAALGSALVMIGLSPEIKTKKDLSESGMQNRASNSPLCFQAVSYGEASIGAKKLIGSAQKRWSDGLLQQGTIPLMRDTRDAMKIFGITSYEDEEESSTCLQELIPELTSEQFKDAIRVSFEETFDVRFVLSAPSGDELSLAAELEVQKYLSDGWTFRR